jgi:serine/threonine protein kinase
MKWLSDQVVSQLQAGVQLPDLTGTRYRAIKFLARGGMGIVWLAEDTILRRNVALKVLDFDSSSGELAARLAREALVLAHLEHPGIVPVHDAGTLPDGRTFYCMKYVEGRTLNQYVSHATVPERLRLLQRVAEPLAFAHSRGIVHRDLKPSNIMVGAFGEVLIMDWGLAKIMNSSVEAPDCTTHRTSETPTSVDALLPTSHGRILGTPGYMSPEQERGDAERVDERTDVFALGAVLNFMLTGATPEVSDPRLMARPLQAICRKAMAPEISARYASVQELSADIGRYLEGSPVSAYRESIPERALRLYTRHRTAVVLVLAYLVMRVLFILFSRR